jgi:hypothetical protein
VEDFDGAVFNEQAGVEFSELEGCRYLEDSPDDIYGEICHVVTPIDLEDEMDDAVFIPDLQVMGEPDDDAPIPDHEEGYEEGDNFVPVHEYMPYIMTIEDDLEFSAEEDSIGDIVEDCEGDNSIDVDPHFVEEEAPAQAVLQIDEPSLDTVECSFHSAHSMVEPTDSETFFEFVRKDSPTFVVQENRDLQNGQTQANSDVSTLKRRDPEGDQPPVTVSPDDDTYVGDDKKELKPSQDVKTEICNEPIEGGPRDLQVVLEEPESETHPKTAETPKRREKAQDKHGLEPTSVENYGTPMQEALAPSHSVEDEGFQGVDSMDNKAEDIPVVDLKDGSKVLQKEENNDDKSSMRVAPPKEALETTSVENYGTPMQEAPAPRADAEEEVDATVVVDSTADDNLEEWVAYMLDGLLETPMKDN